MRLGVVSGLAGRAAFSHGLRQRAKIPAAPGAGKEINRSEEHTSELQSQSNLVCRLLLAKKIEIHPRNLSTETSLPKNVPHSTHVTHPIPHPPQVIHVNLQLTTMITHLLSRMLNVEQFTP